MVASQLLSPSSNDTLFEMLAGFAIVDALEALGYRRRVALITQGPVPFARLDGPGHLTLWWQKSIWSVVSPSDVSRFNSALNASHMSSSSLRPDFLLVSTSPPGLLIVEVKQSEVEFEPERRGLVEAMAYIHDAGTVLSEFPEPHALVVGWNAKATPGLNSIVVTDQDQIESAIKLVLGAWHGIQAVSALERIAMAVHRWWDGIPGEHYWLEVTDRADRGPT